MLLLIAGDDNEAAAYERKATGLVAIAKQRSAGNIFIVTTKYELLSVQVNLCKRVFCEYGVTMFFC